MGPLDNIMPRQETYTVYLLKGKSDKLPTWWENGERGRMLKFKVMRSQVQRSRPKDLS